MTYMMQKQVSEYFSEVNTDKLSIPHNYGYLYDIFFMGLLYKKGTPLNVLEIGVSAFGNGSGHAFSQMPFVEKFVGVDIQPLSHNFGGNGVFINTDAYSIDRINEIKRHGPFNLLIDDGSHLPHDQITFFKEYLDLCESPGILFCEDVRLHNMTEILGKLSDKTIHVVQVPDTYALEFHDGGANNFSLIKFKL